jgi:hypothetical protein
MICRRTGEWRYNFKHPYTHIILPHLTILITLDEECKLRNSSLCRFLLLPVTSFLLHPNIFPSTLFSNILTICKGKNVKLSLCLTHQALRHEDIWGEWMYRSMIFFTSALDGGEWLVSRPGRLTPGERVSGTHWTGGWVPQSRSGSHGEVKILDHTGTRTPAPRSSIL